MSKLKQTDSIDNGSIMIVIEEIKVVIDFEMWHPETFHAMTVIPWVISTCGEDWWYAEVCWIFLKSWGTHALSKNMYVLPTRMVIHLRRTYFSPGIYHHVHNLFSSTRMHVRSQLFTREFILPNLYSTQ